MILLWSYKRDGRSWGIRIRTKTTVRHTKCGRNVVVWEGWSLVVVRQGFYCISNIFWFLSNHYIRYIISWRLMHGNNLDIPNNQRGCEREDTTASNWRLEVARRRMLQWFRHTTKQWRSQGGGQGESRECDLFVNGKNFCYYPPPPHWIRSGNWDHGKFLLLPPPPLNAVGSRRGDENVPGGPPKKNHGYAVATKRRKNKIGSTMDIAERAGIEITTAEDRQKWRKIEVPQRPTKATGMAMAMFTHCAVVLTADSKVKVAYQYQDSFHQSLIDHLYIFSNVSQPWCQKAYWWNTYWCGLSRKIAINGREWPILAGE